MGLGKDDVYTARFSVSAFLRKEQEQEYILDQWNPDPAAN